MIEGILLNEAVSGSLGGAVFSVQFQGRGGRESCGSALFGWPEVHGLYPLDWRV